MAVSLKAGQRIMREKILFDDNWIFHRGDIDMPVPRDKGPIYKQSKTEHMIWGPASRLYGGSPDNFEVTAGMATDYWENVTLPHDYVILQTPSRDENNALGYFKYENAWYRKSFKLSEDDKSKRLTLLFDGVATHATVYLNGCVLKHNFCGYNSFEVEISDYVKFGDEENVLAVYVETGDHEGWWYEGGGIYRHVWLCKTDLVACDLWGVYAAPTKLSDTEWRVRFETTIVNDRYEDVTADAVSVIYDSDGGELGRAAGAVEIRYREKGTAVYETVVKNPKLWDLDLPNLYTVETTISVGGKECDRSVTRIGFRSFKLDPNKGFFLNGRHVKIKGVCSHQDFGLTGKAVPDNIHRYKVELIKEMGANGYRTSHYPHPEAVMDALDELGFIVMDETRWFSSSDEGKEQLEMLVKRDRNRPSVFFWSVGNEEPHHITEEGRRICKNLMAAVRKLDDTRCVMTAVSDDPDKATVYDELDAVGINYNLNLYDKIHEKYPDKPIFSSECCATGTTRGWYGDDSAERAYMSAYDKDTTNWFLGRERTWKFICEREWVLGEYQWIAFEHRGETVWPRLCSQSGAIDLFLQKKDAFYQNQSHWIEDRPILHLLPHWNFRGREGEPIRVVAYTNCEEAELYLNGASLGLQKIERYGHAEWMVPYAPGEIKVEGRDGGKTVLTETRVTAGRAEKLNLKLENKISVANGRDIAVISCYCTDADGNEVPDAAPYVSFSTNKLGCVVGTGSDIADHNPVYLRDRKMRAGRITVAVRVGTTAGELKVYADADGLCGAVLNIVINE